MHADSSRGFGKPTREIVLGAEEPAALAVSPPRVLYTIILLNVAVYLVTSAPTFFTSTTVDWIARLGFIPADLLVDPKSFYRIFTAMFTHGDLLHIFFNMYFLYVFGRAVERTLGSGRFLVLYLVSGIFAALFHTVFTYILNPAGVAVPAVGASGAISGVLGAYMLLFPGTRLEACFFLFFIPVCFSMLAVYYLLFWFSFQVLEGYFAFNSSVAFFAHAGGFIAGIALLPLVADHRRLRLIRRLVQAESLFNILYFIRPPSRPGLSPIAKSLFLLLASTLLTGAAAGYAMSAAHHTLMASYTIDWQLQHNKLGGSDKAFTYITSSGVIPIPSATSTIPARVVLSILAQYDLLYSPRNTGATIRLGPLPPFTTRVRYTLYSTMYIAVSPLAVEASYDEKGLLSHASITARIKAPLYEDIIASTVQRIAVADTATLVSYMAAAALVVTLGAIYVIAFKDREYVITPETL